MLRAKSILIGTLLMMCQLGCGTGSPKKSALPNQPSDPHPDISISPASAIVGSTDLTITITPSETFQFAGGHNNKVLWSANGSDTELSSTLVMPILEILRWDQAQLRFASVDRAAPLAQELRALPLLFETLLDCWEGLIINPTIHE